MKWLGQRAGGYKWMHAQAARKFNRLYNWIGITAIIANVVATGLNVPYVVQCTDEYGWSKILALIIAAIVTAIMSYQQFRDFGDTKAQHIQSEANYGALYDTIKSQLERNANDRQNADDFIEWITKQFGDLKSSSPLIPIGILDTYRRMMAGRNFADPEGIDDIVINRDDDLSSSQSSNSSNSDDLVEVVVESSANPPRSGFLQPRPSFTSGVSDNNNSKSSTISSAPSILLSSSTQGIQPASPVTQKNRLTSSPNALDALKSEKRKESILGLFSPADQLAFERWREQEED
jgi:hypothetical protein